MPEKTPAPAALAHSLFFLVYLAALGAFGSLINDLYLPTLPQMRHEFHTSRSVVQLGLSFGMAGLGLGELYWGPLSDRIGRKPVLYVSLAVFLAAALASVFSPTIFFFNCCRLAQGLGGAGAILLARTIPTDDFSGKALAKIMAVVGAINGIAPAAGPLFGGMMADTIGWRGVFVFLAILGGVMIALGTRLPESLPPARRKKGSLEALLREYVLLTRNRPFMIHVLLKGAALGALFCYLSAGPFILEEHFGFNAFAFGAILGSNALAIVLGSLVSLRFATMKAAAAAGAAGMALFALLDGAALSFTDNFLLFEALVVPLLFFSGMVFSSSNTLAMSEGRDMAGSASAILGLSGYVFGCVVSPLVGLGDIMVSTAIGLAVCSLIALFFGLLSWRLPAMSVQP